MVQQTLSIDTLIIKTIASAISAKKGENILAIQIGKLENMIADFFIICEANNNRQTQAIAEEIKDTVHNTCQQKPMHASSMTNSDWIVMDYVDIIIHIMTKEQRAFYNIEDLWIDVPHFKIT